MGNSEDSKRTDLSDIHAVQLEMMKTLAAVFEKNGLRYALYCGTLLGAIRHRGFIPWDDDVDLVMPLEDYRRFLRLAAKELPRGYVVLTPENSDTHVVPWAKVCLDGTTMMSKSQAAYDTHWGLFVDIYPMIGEHPARVLRKMQTKTIQFIKTVLSLDYYQSLSCISWKGRLFRVLPLSLRRRIANCLLHLCMRPMEKSRRIGSIDGASFCGKYDRTWWEHMTKAPFEDAEFVVPAEYDRILTRMYGDYMTPPPKAWRYGHDYGAGDMIYDTHKDYREYRKELLGV